MDRKDIIRKATIYDVAREAGVSVATFSRVLSGSDYGVSSELKKKVLKYAKKLNYTPNELGRMLKKRESHDIGVVVPTISNPYFSELILGVELEARKHGYNIIICNTFRDIMTEKKHILSLDNKQVKGIILSPTDNIPGSYLSNLADTGTKITLLDNGEKNSKFLNIFYDYFKGGYLAAEYLVTTGHERIAFLTSPLTRYGREKIYEGFKSNPKVNGIAANDKMFICSEEEHETEIGTYEFENGRNLVKRLLKNKPLPDAVFAINDITAFGVISGLLEEGIRVPDDISVMGFDNILFSSMVYPSLTTVNQPAREIGIKSCKQVINALMGNNEEDNFKVSDPIIIERNSVKKRK